MRFWDSSAIVPLCLKQPPSASLRTALDSDPAIVVWWGTIVECYSSFARLRRESILNLSDETQARNIVAELETVWMEIEPSNAVRQQAGRALKIHPLRAADSLQLASALVWVDGQPTGFEFVSLDGRLSEAASLEGFSVVGRETSR